MKKIIIILLICTSCSSVNINRGDVEEINILLGQQILEMMDNLYNKKDAFVYDKPSNLYLINLLENDFKTTADRYINYDSIFQTSDIEYLIGQLRNENKLKIKDFNSSRIKKYIPLDTSKPIKHYSDDVKDYLKIKFYLSNTVFSEDGKWGLVLMTIHETGITMKLFNKNTNGWKFYSNIPIAII